MPDDNPVPWVKTYGANDARAFDTNLGHSMATRERQPDRACTAELVG